MRLDPGNGYGVAGQRREPQNTERPQGHHTGRGDLPRGSRGCDNVTAVDIFSGIK